MTSPTPPAMDTGGGAMAIPEEFASDCDGGGGGGGGVKLKRASSWRKFKDTVKGWVGGQGAPEDQGGTSVGWDRFWG